MNSNQGSGYPAATGSFPMGVHTISLTGAIILLLLAVVIVLFVGWFGLFLLIVVGLLLWYAFGPGRTMVARA